MGATTNYGFPFPVKGDTRFAAADIEALAEAIDAKFLAIERPWWSFVRWTLGSLGTASDAALGGWDLQESNFTLGTPSIGGGVVAPKSGLYLCTADVVFLAVWAGIPLMSMGIKTSAAAPREIYLQRNENNSAGSQRRSYSVSGMLRMVAGETANVFMNQPGGTGTVNHSPGTSPGDRSASRFSGLWVGP